MTFVIPVACNPALARQRRLAQGARMDNLESPAVRLPDWVWIERLRALRTRVERHLLPPVMPLGESAWMPLLYLGFLCMPVVFPFFGHYDYTLTLCAIAAFLPMHFGVFWLSGWRRAALALAIAALAPALLPANPFANTFTIYGVLSAATMPLGAALGVFVAGLSMLLAVHWVVDSQGTLFVVLLTALISSTSFIAQRMYAASARKQAALRLSQEEVERLAKVAERERIGRDLHDLLGHTLSVVAIKAELANKLFSRDPAAAQAEIADVEMIAREALGQVRRAVTGMRAVGIRAEFANARLALGAVAVDFDYRAPDFGLHPEVETVLALALREAATNIIRHAGAKRCHAELLREGANVVLIVRDDGVGGATVDGNGLSGMRERIEGLGGSLSVLSERGRGTQLRIALPWRERDPEGPGRDEATRARHLRAVG
jgi:two-component system sensor histidine kinase DesK